MSNRRRHIVYLGLLTIITALCFARGMRYDFLKNWDDGIFIVENRHLTLTPKDLKRYALHPYRQLYTPLPMYSLALDKMLFGTENALGFHLHNLLLHLACAILLYLIAVKLNISPTLSFALALLWAVNPQKNESVLWIVERKDLLCGLFAFGGFYAFLFALEPKGRWQHLVICSLLSVLSLGCKPASAPLFGIYLLFPLLKGQWRWRVLWPTAATAAAIIWTAIITMQDNPGIVEPNIMVPLHNLLWYPVTAVLPIFTCLPIYPPVGTFAEHWQLYIFTPLAAIALICCARYVKKLPARSIVIALLLLGGSSLPVIGLWQYTHFHYCDRYNYLVSAVTLLILAPLVPPRRISWWCLGTLAALMFISAQLTTSVWASSRNIWITPAKRPGRLNVKVIELASGDALLRNDANDLHFIADLMEQHADEYPLPDRQVEHSWKVIRARAFFIQNDFERGCALLDELDREERAAGRPLKFMKGKNYPVVYEEDYGLLQFYRLTRNKNRN